VWDVDTTPPAPGEPLEVSPGVFLLLAPNANSWTFEGTNTWVIAGGGRAVVVDPGPADEQHLDRIDDLVRSTGSRVREVLLTHHHGDHAAAATGVAARWDAGIRPRVQAGVIPEGTTLHLGRLQVQAYRTPGHTADGVSFALASRRLVLTGDTVLARVNPFISHPDGTVADMLASMRRIADLVDDDWALLPGHGPAVRTPRHYLGRRIIDRRRRIDQVADLLRDGVDRGEVASVVYAKVDPARLPAARASVEAILHYLDATTTLTTPRKAVPR
jgi:glyoxylase-like metal-dependent hydrolase (beta-lactamase superfamily II)